MSEFQEALIDETESTIKGICCVLDSVTCKMDQLRILHQGKYFFNRSGGQLHGWSVLMESSGCISTRCPHPEVGIEGGGALERLLPEEMQLGVSSSIGGTASDW